MGDYIKREDAIASIMAHDLVEDVDGSREWAEHLLEDATIKDVVEVIRCKDCIYNDRGWCGAQEYGTRHIEDNDYCSYGERKEQEHDKND